MSQDFLSNINLEFEFCKQSVKLLLDIDTKNTLKNYRVDELHPDFKNYLESKFANLKLLKSDIFSYLMEQVFQEEVTDKKNLLFAIYESIKNEFDAEKLELRKDQFIFCRCFSVSKNQITSAIKEYDIYDMRTLTNATKAGGGCGSCVKEVVKDFELHLFVDTIEQAESDICKVTRKEDKIRYLGKEYFQAEFLTKFLFPLEGVEILSLVDHHLYVKGQSKDLDRICLAANIKMFTS